MMSQKDSRGAKDVPSIEDRKKKFWPAIIGKKSFSEGKRWEKGRTGGAQ